MQPIVEPKAGNGFGHRLALTALVGVSVLSVAVVVLLAIYVDRISDMATGLRRVDALADYAGRPAPVQVAENPAMNFLILVSSGPHLQAVVVANLSGSRRDLTLVALPADLIPDGSSPTLADAYASSPLDATQLVEQITGARMDHQLQLDLDGFAAVVDGLDGLQLSTGQLDGTQAVTYLSGADSTLQRSQRAAEMIRQAMIEAEANGGVLNLPRFDRVVGALGGCLTIDSGLSNDAIEAILVESRVHIADVGLWPVAGAQTRVGTLADSGSLNALREGLATDALAETPQLSLSGPGRVGTAVRSQATGGGTPQPTLAASSATQVSDAPDQAPAATPTAAVSGESVAPTDAGSASASSSTPAQTSR